MRSTPFTRRLSNSLELDIVSVRMKELNKHFRRVLQDPSPHKIDFPQISQAIYTFVPFPQHMRELHIIKIFGKKLTIHGGGSIFSCCMHSFIILTTTSKSSSTNILWNPLSLPSRRPNLRPQSLTEKLFVPLTLTV